MTLDNEFAATRRPVSRARHLPGSIYASPELFAREKDAIFLKDWLVVGRVEELANPGDYLTLRVMDEPILVTRDDRGRLNAFANVCLHRGVEVATGSGHAREFSCPYHGWLYDLEGCLIGAPHMKDAHGFDPKACRLPPLALDTWAGWIFVTFDRDPPSLRDFVAAFERDYGFFKQENCRLAEKHRMSFKCNWKLIVENLLDFYHVVTLHRATLGRGFDLESMPFTLDPEGRFSSFYFREPVTETGKPLLPLMPTMRDKPAHLNSVGFLPPNFNIIFRPDYVRPFVIWPLTPTTCELIAYPLFPIEDFALPEFARAARAYRDFHERTLEEDLDMVQSLQNAMRSRHFTPGPMSKIEGAVHHAITHYLDRMFPAPPRA